MLRLSVTIIAALVLAGCGKETNNKVSVLPENDTFHFAILPISDLSMLSRDTVTFTMSINAISGTPKPASINFLNLPVGLGANFSIQIDTPGFNSMVTMTAMDVVPGVYPVAVLAASAELSVRDTFYVEVKPVPVNPSLALVASYAESGQCTVTGPVSNNVTVQAYSPNGVFNQIKIKNFWSAAGQINAIAVINPADSSLIIAPQQFGQISVSGSGHYSLSGLINLSYSIQSGSFVFDTCTTVLARLP